MTHGGETRPGEKRGDMKRKEVGEALIERVNAQNATAKRNGGIVIACGMAKCEGDASVALVFERADQNMFGNKNDLKAQKNG